MLPRSSQNTKRPSYPDSVVGTLRAFPCPFLSFANFFCVLALKDSIIRRHPTRNPRVSDFLRSLV
ncbi:hypothetical protein CONLIGDRAFT_58915 [Coniochaeta ligniaria NRRL 30616]|uniref:Uncharacterized protein n=1 Tax=Coniochaeta ligniaria NRRL 30616 TaxID=1408157 RepID=A0A1J7J6Q1_9PEZI|nr:hypothetical protein CONLIGDRAFT_58915 [Coniochaeta ligniaria NRRL 30616]